MRANARYSAALLAYGIRMRPPAPLVSAWSAAARFMEHPWHRDASVRRSASGSTTQPFWHRGGAVAADIVHAQCPYIYASLPVQIACDNAHGSPAPAPRACVRWRRGSAHIPGHPANVAALCSQVSDVAESHKTDLDQAHQAPPFYGKMVSAHALMTARLRPIRITKGSLYRALRYSTLCRPKVK